MAMGFTSLAALMIGVAAHRNAPWMLLPAAALFAVAAAIWRYARRRARDPAARTARRPLALLAVAAAGAGVVAAVPALMRLG
jgi:hypothetical protein